MGRERSLFIHVTLLPYIPAAGELKTKPTQHSVKELMGMGIRPRILLCRADREIAEEELKKISLFCNIDENKVIPALDASSIYEVPLSYHKVGLDTQVLDAFGLNDGKEPDLEKWERIMRRIKNPEGEVTIAVVGKYTNLNDSYKSLNEALTHGGIANKVKVNINFIEASLFDQSNEDIAHALDGVNGILVPGGFGERGAEGKIKAAQYAREKKIPYFGICFGLQMAVLETARHLAGVSNANSTEFSEDGEHVIGLMTEWTDGNKKQKRSREEDLGGTMRLGAFPAHLKKGSKVAEIYGQTEISERHRHRFEVNINYKDKLEEAGFIMSGTSPDGTLPEI
ncbi:unnamed protein product, partial [Cyprideis torosa]